MGGRGAKEGERSHRRNHRGRFPCDAMMDGADGTASTEINDAAGATVAASLFGSDIFSAAQPNLNLTNRGDIYGHLGMRRISKELDYKYNPSIFQNGSRAVFDFPPLRSPFFFIDGSLGLPFPGKIPPNIIPLYRAIHFGVDSSGKSFPFFGGGKECPRE